MLIAYLAVGLIVAIGLSSLALYFGAPLWVAIVIYILAGASLVVAGAWSRVLCRNAALNPPKEPETLQASSGPAADS